MVYANMYKWGHITLASIRGGMSMISNILTVLSFAVLLLSTMIDCNFPSRLLGVLNILFCNLLCITNDMLLCNIIKSAFSLLIIKKTLFFYLEELHFFMIQVYQYPTEY